MLCDLLQVTKHLQICFLIEKTGLIKSNPPGDLGMFNRMIKNCAWCLPHGKFSRNVNCYHSLPSPDPKEMKERKRPSMQSILCTGGRGTTNKAWEWNSENQRGWSNPDSVVDRALGFGWLTPDETLLTLPVFPDTSTPVLREQPTRCVYTVNIHQNSFAALGASLLEHRLPKAFTALTRSKGSLWSLPHLVCRTRALKSNRP